MSSRTIRPGLALGLCSLAIACAVAENDRPTLPSNAGGAAGSEAGGTTGGLTAAGTTSAPLGGSPNGGSSAPGGTGTGGSGGSASGGASVGGSGGSGGGGAGKAGAGGMGSGGTLGNAGSGGAGKAGAGGTGSGGTLGSAGSAGATGQGGTGVPTVCPMPVGAQTALPLVVTQNFIASGYFAGPAANTAGIVAAACENRPPGNTIGACSKFTFQASVLDGTGAYGGVFWQFGLNNWGTAPGMNVAPGATKVTFKAWSAGTGGEQVEFSAGGIGDGNSLCADTVNLGIGGGNKVTLTTTPTQYTVDLKGQTYAKGIIGGFVWSTAVTSVAQVVSFYVDEIQWVQ